MRKTFVHFFTIADYEEEEAWLSQKHSEGWKFVKLTPPCFYVFEECEPEDVVYRMDYKNAGETEDYLQMMRDFGWEYFAKCLGWLYFRKKAEGTAEERELFSDDASRAEMAAQVARTRLIPMCVIFLCCILPNFIISLNGQPFGGWRLAATIVFSALFAFYEFLLIYCGAKLARIRRKYRG